MDNVGAQFHDHLVDALARMQIPATEKELTLLCQHYDAMIETNRMFNLTRITEPEDAAVKHYADALSVLQWTDRKARQINRVLDVGTGAGFPAIPLAVMRSTWRVTAIDSTRKKIDFVEQASRSMGLKNLQCNHVHTDHWKVEDPAVRKSRGFDLVVFRALGALSKAIGLSARFVAPRRYAIAYVTESTTLQPGDLDVLKQHRLQLVDRVEYELQIKDEILKRSLYVFCKSGS